MDSLLKRLCEARYSADDIRSTLQITQPALATYISSPLRLISESAGQGKARAFVLADVYQIGLLASYAKFARSLPRIAVFLNRMMGFDEKYAYIKDEHGNDNFKNLRPAIIASNAAIKNIVIDPGISHSVRPISVPASDEKNENTRRAREFQFLSEETPKLYLSRDIENPFYLISDANFEYARVEDDIRNYQSGYFLNVTEALTEIDSALARRIGLQT